MYRNLVKLGKSLQYVETACKNTSQNTILKKTLFWVSELWFKLFFLYECHTFNFDFFWLEFFLHPIIWPFCFFASQHFWNLHSVGSFFVKRTFSIFFYDISIFFLENKKYYYEPKGQIWCQTSNFESGKIMDLKLTSRLQFIPFLICSSSPLPPTNLPLAHLFCLRWFRPFLVKKR